MSIININYDTGDAWNNELNIYKDKCKNLLWNLLEI